MKKVKMNGWQNARVFPTCKHGLDVNHKQWTMLHQHKNTKLLTVAEWSLELTKANTLTWSLFFYAMLAEVIQAKTWDVVRHLSCYVQNFPTDQSLPATSWLWLVFNTLWWVTSVGNTSVCCDSLIWTQRWRTRFCTEHICFTAISVALLPQKLILSIPSTRAAGYKMRTHTSTHTHTRLHEAYNRQMIFALKDLWEGNPLEEKMPSGFHFKSSSKTISLPIDV